MTSSINVDAAGLTYDGSIGVREPHAIAVETPVNVIYGSIPFAVMMTCPADLEDFAFGFSFTEGIVDDAEGIRSVAIEEAGGAIKLSISLKGDNLQRHLGRSRSIAGRTGCGVCGISDLSAMPKAKTLPDTGQEVDASAIGRALKDSQAMQLLNAATRSVHGAAFCNWDGTIVAVREDVGRHNALDKLIGTLLRTGVHPGDGFLLITSRASFEMIEKSVRFGASVLVAMSAPTSLAIERAAAYGLTLIAVARDDGAIVFSTGVTKIKRETR